MQIFEQELIKAHENHYKQHEIIDLHEIPAWLKLCYGMSQDGNKNQH